MFNHDKNNYNLNKTIVFPTQQLLHLQNERSRISFEVEGNNKAATLQKVFYLLVASHIIVFNDAIIESYTAAHFTRD